MRRKGVLVTGPTRTARELEIAAAAVRLPESPRMPVPSGEAMAMLTRRGLLPLSTLPDVPFPADLPEETAEALSERLRHYSFRLFLRGAIQQSGGFVPRQATRYLKPSQARECADVLASLGLAERLPRGRYRLIHPARTFGGTLEWYVARELRLRYGFEVATGVKCHAPGVGGDLDVVAAAEGRLFYLELKSSPPKNLSAGEVSAFFDRVRALGPDVSLFVVDTALRLGDKVLPMLASEMKSRGLGGGVAPRRLERQLWVLTPRLYAVNGERDLISNIGRAIAAALRALHSPL
jgi:hypothetical protein